jgi:hypothetical protein
MIREKNLTIKTLQFQINQFLDGKQSLQPSFHFKKIACLLATNLKLILASKNRKDYENTHAAHLHMFFMPPCAGHMAAWVPGHGLPVSS